MFRNRLSISDHRLLQAQLWLMWTVLWSTV